MTVRLTNNMSVNVPVSDIVDFFNGKKVFITGATGFLGSVLLRKILKECGEGVEALYLLVRNKRGEDAKVRLQRLLKDQVKKVFLNLIKLEVVGVIAALTYK